MSNGNNPDTPGSGTEKKGPTPTPKDNQKPPQNRIIVVAAAVGGLIGGLLGALIGSCAR